MKIPDDIFFRVLELATALVNSLESFDKEVGRRPYSELQTICETETAAGRGHPFLWETLADFTDDDATAIDLYQKGLALASAPEAAAFRASIQLALAERYRSIGDPESAHRFALAAAEEARALDDPELHQSISEFLSNEDRLI